MVNFGTNKENFGTMLQQKKQRKNMQLHIDNIYNFLDAHLPYSYVDEVIEIMKKKGIEIPSKTTIRKVRSRASKSYEKRTDVINALVEIANNKKKEVEKINRKISA